MDLFEFFREKVIRITPGTQVAVKYITVGTPSDLFSLAEGELLLVKKQITREDLALLKAHAWSSIVFTAPPQALEELDVQKELREVAEAHHLETIGLNYLHFGKTLLVFGELGGTAADPSVPNAICITPVHREQVETQLAVDLEALRSVQGEREAAPEQRTPGPAGPEEKKTPAQKAPSELDMVRAELKRQFEERYSVVKAEFKGTSLEAKRVSLSQFYRDHGIAQGRLTGSWKLFDKQSAGESLDAGIANRAVGGVYRRLTVMVPGYGRIVRAEHMAEFRDSLAGIKGDYRDYVSGKPCRSIGGIAVTKPFAPWQKIEESLKALTDHLIGISPVKGLDLEAYIQDVKWFVEDRRDEMDRMFQKVSLRISETSYKEGQWSDRAFVSSLYRAAVNHWEFFDGAFVDLLKRCIGLMKADR